jgi:hypothetical protein
MSQRKAKRLRKQAEMLVFNRCSCCGDISEINPNDDYSLVSAFAGGNLIAISKDDFKKLQRGRK